MSFTPTADLPDNPDVRVLFTGQMIIQPDAQGNTCEVFINRRAPDHQLSIEVREKHTGQVDGFWMRHMGPLMFGNPVPGTEQPLFGMLMQKTAGAAGVKMYTGDPLPGGEEALARAINLESEEFHKGKANVELEGGRPSIFMNDGIFYTAAKTSDKLTLKLKKGDASQTINPFANVIGANIYLEPNEKLSLVWRGATGGIEVLELEKLKDGGSYEIYVVNDPPFVDPEAAKTHDEFQQYYAILPQVPNEDKFSLDFEHKDEAERGSIKIPCMPVIGG